MEHLFEKPSIYHYILSLNKEQMNGFGHLVFSRLKVKDQDFMKPVYFLLRKGYDPNTYITKKSKRFIPNAPRFEEMFVDEEVKKHCFDFIIDLFEEYSEFEENALLYFHACGINLDLKCEDDPNSKTLREKIKVKWDEFEDYENVEDYSFAYILDILDIPNPNRYGIDLENKSFLVKELNASDKQHCIDCYANSFVTEYTLEQAIKSYNIELVQKNEELHVDPKLVQFLLSNLKNKTAQECLLLLCNRDISLSVHDIQHLPQNKKEQLLKVYKTPMYLSNPNFKKVMFPKYFYKEDVEEEFLNKLKDQEFCDRLIEKYRENNKKAILCSNTYFYDNYKNTIPTIVNDCDLIGENPFDFPLQSIFCSRIENLIYVFTPNDFDSIHKNRKNPYTNTEMANIPELEKTISISDFLEELRNGKKLHTENVNQTNQIQAQMIVYDFDTFPLSQNNPFQFLIDSLTNFSTINMTIFDENFEE